MKKEVLQIKKYQEKTVDVQQDLKWWKRKEELPESVWEVVRQIDENQTYRTNNYLKFLRLYQNQQIVGLNQGEWNKYIPRIHNNSLSLNIIASMIDTVCSKISHSQPKPLFLTSDGDYSQKRRAKLLTKYCEGMFEQLKIYQIGVEVFRDACVFGTGAIKLALSDGRIIAERVAVNELVIDEIEGKDNNHRQLFQKKIVDRDSLVAQFPEKAAEIFRADPAIEANSMRDGRIIDQVMVVESWHLPSGRNTKDGKHVICLNQSVLIEEDYDKSYFPFVLFKWKTSLFGPFGIGLAEELMGLQQELNKIIRSISRSLELTIGPRVMIDNASNVNTAQINSEIGSIIRYSGNPPQYVTPQAVNPEVYQYLENLYRKAYEISGVSTMDAFAQKAPSIVSGQAIRNLTDIASARFQTTGQRWEQFFMEIARQLIELSEDITKGEDAEAKKALQVRVANKKAMRVIDYKSIRLDDGDFIMSCFPVNILPSQPAGRLQTVQDLFQAGFIDQDTAMSLLDFPDLESKLNLKLAAQNNIERKIEIMLDDGEPQFPEPFDNLALSLTMVQEAYSKGKLDKAPEDNLELLRTYMDQVTRMMNESQQPALPPEAQPGGQEIMQGPQAPQAQMQQ